MLARAFSPSTLRQKQVDSGSRTRVNKLGDKYLYLGGNAFIFCAILIAPKITLRMTGTQKTVISENHIILGKMFLIHLPALSA